MFETWALLTQLFKLSPQGIANIFRRHDIRIEWLERQLNEALIFSQQSGTAHPELASRKDALESAIEAKKGVVAMFDRIAACQANPDVVAWEKTMSANWNLDRWTVWAWDNHVPVEVIRAARWAQAKTPEVVADYGPQVIVVLTIGATIYGGYLFYKNFFKENQPEATKAEQSATKAEQSATKAEQSATKVEQSATNEPSE